MNHIYTNWATTLKTLGHPIRLKIVKMLMDDEQYVWNLWKCLELQQSVVSQHLAILRRKGIVGCCRKGTKVSYFVKNNDVKELIKIIEKNNS